MKSQAIAKMEDLIIDGKPEVMKKFKNSVTILVDEKKLLVLKFAGLNGMQVEVAINLNNSPVKTYTFYSIAPFGNRRILITEDGDALYLYSTTPTLDEYKSYTIVVNGMVDPVISGIYKFFERLNARYAYKKLKLFLRSSVLGRLTSMKPRICIFTTVKTTSPPQDG